MVLSRSLSLFFESLLSLGGKAKSKGFSRSSMSWSRPFGETEMRLCFLVVQQT